MTRDTHRDCGGQTFWVANTAAIKQTFTILPHGEWLETNVEVFDYANRLGEQDEFECVECGETIIENDLVTQDDYAHEGALPEFHCPGCSGEEFTELGSLGSARWLRCRACGLDSRHPERELSHAA